MCLYCLENIILAKMTLKTIKMYPNLMSKGALKKQKQSLQGK